MLSVIVPCYNEERNLPFLAAGFEKALKGLDAELILVNNGSTDNSQEIMEKLEKEYTFIHIARIEKNIGYGHGILTGLKAAHGDILAYTHADLQCDPDDVARAYEVYESSGSRVLVKGSREGRFSLLTSVFHVVAAVLFFKKFDDINGQPKLFHRNLMETFKNPPPGFQLDFYLQYKAKQNNYNVISIPVKFGARRFGHSKWATGIKPRIKNISRWLGYMIKLRFAGE